MTYEVVIKLEDEIISSDFNADIAIARVREANAKSRVKTFVFSLLTISFVVWLFASDYIARM